MKKVALIITLALVVSLFTACGVADTLDATEKSDNTTVETTKKDEDIVRIAVEKSLLADADTFVQNMKDYGAEVNDYSEIDGYLLVFSKAEHEKLLKDKYTEAVNKLKEYEDNAEHYIDTIEYDEDFRNMTFYVDRELYDSTGSTTGNIVVASSALSYQIYLEDGQKTNVKVVYSDTEEEVTSFFLPMNLSIEQ